MAQAEQRAELPSQLVARAVGRGANLLEHDFGGGGVEPIANEVNAFLEGPDDLEAMEEEHASLTLHGVLFRYNYSAVHDLLSPNHSSFVPMSVASASHMRGGDG
jgi:hypothetical protein